jgi:hypothetical protein
MSIFKAYKGHRQTARQVEDIIHRYGDYYSIDELLIEVPTEILIEWLTKNGIEPNHKAPPEIQGVLNELRYTDKGHK